jgi:glucose/arabinose dehydrogenase
MLRYRRVLVPAAAVVAVVVLGCGSGDRASAQPTRTPPPEPAATEPPPAATAQATPAPTAAPVGRPGLRLRRIGTFASPLYVTAPPGDRRRIFVVEQGGTVRIVRGGRVQRRPFLDISSRVDAGGERGLLSLAFAPDYARSGRFYVYYTGDGGDIRVVEYRRASAERADHGSARLVLLQSHPASNHNGGPLVFGPDGLLYIGIGDGGGGGDLHGPRGNGQNLGTLLGKILRIDPRPQGDRRYRIPPSNPFVGQAGARGEIYAYGLRNPWRFAFDPRTSDLVVADVGQNEVEEVSIIRRKGANLGWRPFEGRRRYTPGERAPGHVPPVIQRWHSNGNCSITGGVVVRDRVLSALRGRYVFGDFCRGRIESALLRGGRARDVRTSRLEVDSLSSFGEDGRGRVYVTSLNGPVFRLEPR